MGLCHVFPEFRVVGSTQNWSYKLTSGKTGGKMCWINNNWAADCWVLQKFGRPTYVLYGSAECVDSVRWCIIGLVIKAQNDGPSSCNAQKQEYLLAKWQSVRNGERPPMLATKQNNKNTTVQMQQKSTNI